MSQLAQAYTTCDRYFCSILGPTYPNRFFQHAAQTDRLDDALTPSTLPTIWDQLNQSRRSHRPLLLQRLPVHWRCGEPSTSRFPKILAIPQDAAAGTLPNVSYVDPRFIGEDDGTSADDHPLADIRAGDAFLSQVFHAVATGPGWDKTVLVINYDEWGGFFDHVAPRAASPPGGRRRRQPRRSGVDTDLDAAGQGAVGLPGALHRGLALQPHRGKPGRGQPQLLRPHLGAQD